MTDVLPEQRVQEIVRVATVVYGMEPGQVRPIVERLPASRVAARSDAELARGCWLAATVHQRATD